MVQKKDIIFCQSQVAYQSNLSYAKNRDALVAEHNRQAMIRAKIDPMEEPPSILPIC